MSDLTSAINEVKSSIQTALDALHARHEEIAGAIKVFENLVDRLDEIRDEAEEVDLESLGVDL